MYKLPHLGFLVALWKRMSSTMSKHGKHKVPPAKFVSSWARDEYESTTKEW